MKEEGLLWVGRGVYNSPRKGELAALAIISRGIHANLEMKRLRAAARPTPTLGERNGLRG